tara:strand:+ start:2347 stop:4263 length:1917 start_codon:yes stop_codon:yes gene_type:complete
MGVYEDALAIARRDSSSLSSKDVNRELKIMSFIENILGQEGRQSKLKMDNLRDQGYIQNQFTNTVSRFMSAYTNPDGTISNENIGNVRNQIEKLQFQYEKQFPNSIELIGMQSEGFNAKLNQAENSNIKYENMNFQLNNLMGEGEGSLTSLLGKYGNLTSEDVINNREELINELSTVTKNVGDFKKTFDSNNFNSRIGSSTLTDNMTKSAVIVKSLQQQLLDIDSASPNKILTKSERIAFEQYLENDSIELLNDINKDNEENIKNKKKQSFEAIENNLSLINEANNILNLAKNKEYMASNPNMTLVKIGKNGSEVDSGRTANEWIQIKNNAKNDLIVGKYDEKLRNLYSSGMGYLDLYSDRPLASIIESNEDLHDVFNYKTNKLPMNKRINTGPPKSNIEPEVGSLRYKESQKTTQVKKEDGKSNQNDAKRLAEIDEYMAQEIETSSGKRRRINAPQDSSGKYIDPSIEKAFNEGAELRKKQANSHLNHINTYLQIKDGSKLTNNKKVQEFAKEIQKETGWRMGSVSRAIGKLRQISKLVDELNSIKKETNFRGSPEAIRNKEKQIQNAKSDYLNWAQTGYIFPAKKPFNETVKTLTKDELLRYSNRDYAGPPSYKKIADNELRKRGVGIPFKETLRR